MRIALPAHDPADRMSVNAKVPRDVTVALPVFREFPNIWHQILRHFAVRPVRRLGAMLASAAAVFGVCFIAEITQSIIAAISVKVRGLHAVWHGPHKRFQHQSMNGKHLALSIRAKVHSEIAVPFSDGLQKIAAVIAEDATLIGNKVNALISDHGFERLEHAAEYHKMRSVASHGQVGRVYVTPEMLS